MQQWQGPGNAWFDFPLAVFPLRGASSQQDKHTSSVKNQGIGAVEGISTSPPEKSIKPVWSLFGCLLEAKQKCSPAELQDSDQKRCQIHSHLSQNILKPFNLLSRKLKGVMKTLKARSSNNVFRNNRHSYTLFPLYITSLIMQKYSHQDFAENWTKFQ